MKPTDKEIDLLASMMIEDTLAKGIKLSKGCKHCNLVAASLLRMQEAIAVEIKVLLKIKGNTFDEKFEMLRDLTREIGTAHPPEN